MNLDNENGRKAKDFLKNKWMNQCCAICNQIAWSLPPAVYEMQVYRGKQAEERGQVFPVILLVCGNCGYTLHFNAAVLGVVEPGEE